MCEAEVWHILIIGLALFIANSIGKRQARKEFEQTAIDISAALSRASIALDAVEEELLNTNFACSLFQEAAKVKNVHVQKEEAKC